MKSIIQQIATKNKEREAQAAKARQAEIDHPTTSDNRRSFQKNSTRWNRNDQPVRLDF